VGKSNYSDELRAQLDASSLRIAAELLKLNDSGATTTDDRQRAYDEFLANLPADLRAKLVAETMDQRGQIEAMLEGSGYKGDLDSMNLPDLANLAAARGLLTLEGTATLPTTSALDAAAAAAQAGGSFHLNPMTGGIWIYRDSNATILHDYLPGGSEGPPPGVVFDEVASDSDRGGARPTGAQIDAVLGDGATDYSFGPGGEVIGKFPDGSTRSYPNDPFQQGLEDLGHADGRIGDIASALDGALTRGGEDFMRGIQGAIDDMSRTRYDSIGGSGAAAGMSGTSTTPGGGMTGGGGGGTGPATNSTDANQGGTPRHSGPLTGASNQWDSSMDVDDFSWTNDSSGGGGGDSGSDSTPEHPSNPPAGATNSNEPNEIVDRSDRDEPVQDDDEDGWDSSTKDPPTNSTYVDSDGDGIPDDEEEEDDSDPSTEYTPAPDSGDWRNLSQGEVDRLLEAAQTRSTGRESWWDGTAVRPAQWDAEFARALQERKVDMLGNPGSPDLDSGGGGGFVPPDTIPQPNPDDDTPGHDTDGVDNGSEDPMQQHVQSPLDPSIINGGGESMPLQEMVTAEIDPESTRPLEVMVAAEINVVGTPTIPGYLHALGDPVSGAPPPPEDEPGSMMAMTDGRLASPISIPETFRVASRDAEEDDPDAG
jgi:hypothetical protein